MVRWILYNLGTCSIEETTEAHKLYFAGVALIDIRDIADGKNETIEQILKHLRTIRYLLKEGYRVVIRCRAGISRSNTLVIGILHLVYNLSYEDSEDLVKTKVPETNLNLDLMNDMKRAIEFLKKEEKSCP